MRGAGCSRCRASGNASSTRTRTTVGTIAISANAISRYITFSVDKTALGGTPTSGWSFTVTLTGQDGFSPDQARAFAPTPQAFYFGVCAASSADPHCTFDPQPVPKVIDTLMPSGVAAVRRTRLHATQPGRTPRRSHAIAQPKRKPRPACPPTTRSPRSATVSAASSESTRALLHSSIVDRAGWAGEAFNSWACVANVAVRFRRVSGSRPT